MFKTMIINENDDGGADNNNDDNIDGDRICYSMQVDRSGDMRDSWYSGQVTEYKGRKSEVTETAAGDKDRVSHRGNAADKEGR